MSAAAKPCPGCPSRLHWKEENGDRHLYLEWLEAQDAEGESE
jgi:hypothetical protein